MPAPTETVKKSASSTQRHKDTKKDNKLKCLRLKSGSPLPCPKSFDSHRLLDDFAPGLLLTELLLVFLVPWCLLCWMTLVVFFHTFTTAGETPALRPAYRRSLPANVQSIPVLLL
jgi:hypothetical protein